MKIGIVSCGAYIPVYRLDRKIAAEAWGRNAIGGERTVANNDEDSLTMAVEATRNCLVDAQIPTKDLEGVYFASTTAPYTEKLSAALVATVLDMPQAITTADFAQSLRAGTGALKAGLDAVGAGSVKNMIVTAAETRIAYPKSDLEQDFGDGAGSVLLGSGDNLIAVYEGSFSICNEMVDVWRNPEDRYVKTWENRFIMTEGYSKQLNQAIAGLLKKYNLKKEDIKKVVIPSVDSRSYRGVAEKLGFDVKTQVQDPFMASVGFCGTAEPLLLLVAALEDAKPGDLILLASYADGADAMLFRATDKIANAVKRATLKKMISEKIMITSYSKFLSYKGILESNPGEPFRLMPSATVSWRERNSVLRFHASHCKSCGTTAYPVQRVCEKCLSKDNYDEVRIADMQGKVFTFTRDNLAGRSDDPVIMQTIVEFDNGVRFYGLMTDCVLDKVDLGMPVKMVFRRIYEGAGFHNYFWKCTPVEKGV